MDVLFILKHPGYTRNLESTLRELGDRGHSVHLAFDTMSGEGGEQVVDGLREAYPRFSVGRTPKGGGLDPWYALSRRLRLTLDYLRYLEPRYAGAAKLKDRAAKSAPRPIRKVFALPFVSRPFLVRRALAVFRAVELATPPPEYALEFIREHDPDVLLVTPLVGFGSSQADYVRAARKLRIPTGLCVHSWDNLTNKGLIREAPDLVAVWNHAQVQEAVELHHVAQERVSVTGAVAYDHWFGWSPSRDRREFCLDVGLDPELPFLLYVCSSRFVGPDESSFVERWIEQLRSSGQPALENAGVLVRPHPQNAEQWGSWTPPDTAVAVWPRDGANPVDDDSRSDYYDSIHHSAGIIGINTSALIEGAIVGRPVHTILDPEFRDTQEGTLHFGYLLEQANGPLQIADSFDEHFKHLAQSVAGPTGDLEERHRRFLSAFIRPQGLDEPAAPLLANAIEQMDRDPISLEEAARNVLLRAALRSVSRWAQQRHHEYKEALRRKKAKREAKEASRLRRRKAEGKERRKAAERAAAVDRRTPPRTKLVVHGQSPVSPPSAPSEAKPAEPAPPLAEPAQDVAEPILPAAQPVPEPAASFPEPAPEAAPPSAEPVEAARERVRALAQGNARPVLAGPWLSEIGYELLYWIPFLSWCVERHPELRERLTVVSRGGNAQWYERLGIGYADLFDLYEPAELNRLSEDASQREARGQRKQMVATTFDTAVLKNVAGELALEEPEFLHPSVMYQAYWQLVKRRAIVPPQEDSIFAYHPIPRPDRDEFLDRLPAEYVAVRFYFSTAFPETVENTRTMRSVLEAIARESEVVLLNPPMRIDDHWDFDPSQSDRIHRLDDLMTATNNLRIQTEAIAHSRAFVGTYGGLSYLAPFLGVRSVAIYGAGVKVKAHHLDLAGRLFSEPPYGGFVARTTDRLDLSSPSRLLGAEEARLGPSPEPRPAPIEAEPPAAAAKAEPPSEPQPAPSPAEAPDPVDRARQLARRLTDEVQDPVVTGPWRGTTREELLYWIPFLTWVVDEHPTLADRLIVTAGQGRSDWYRHLGTDLVELKLGRLAGALGAATNGGSADGQDVHALVRPFRASLEFDGTPAVLDPQVLTDAVAHLRARDVIAKLKRKAIFTYRPMQQPETGWLGGRLPQDYVAVDLEALESIAPASHGVASMLSAAGAAGEVIVLDRPAHGPVPADVTCLSDLVEAGEGPVANTAALSGAKLAIAGANGLAFLAPQLGVPTLAVFDPERDPNKQDLDLAERIFQREDLGSFLAVSSSAEEAKLVDSINLTYARAR